MAADGEIVSNTEIEAAEELGRMLRRVGIPDRWADGFSAYRVFRWFAVRRAVERRRRDG
jgi:hypothetical protein